MESCSRDVPHPILATSVRPRGRGELDPPPVRGEVGRHAKAGHPRGHKGVQDCLGGALSRTASGHLMDLSIMVSRWERWERPHDVHVHVAETAVGMSIFSTVVVGCLVTLARLQAAHSLHQATTSVARPGQTKRGATSCRVALRPA